MPINAGDPGTADLIDAYLGLYRRKTIDESVASSTTLQDDDDLQWVIPSSMVNTSWDLRLIGHYVNAAGTGPGLKFGFAYTAAGATFTWTAFGVDNASGNYHGDAGKSIGSTDLVQSSSAIRRVTVDGILDIGANAGTFKFQWTQNVSNATATIMKAGTYACLKRIT